MTDLFRQADIDRMIGHLRAMGAPFGITFADRPFLSNSHAALIAAEFARDRGKFQEVHEAIFAAYFSRALDIGDPAVLSDIVQEAGIEPSLLAEAVKDTTYAARLQQAQKMASDAGVTGVPTFVIDNKRTIVGAQPLDVFRKALTKKK